METPGTGTRQEMAKVSAQHLLTSETQEVLSYPSHREAHQSLWELLKEMPAATAGTVSAGKAALDDSPMLKAGAHGPTGTSSKDSLSLDHPAEVIPRILIVRGFVPFYSVPLGRQWPR